MFREDQTLKPVQCTTHGNTQHRLDVGASISFSIWEVWEGNEHEKYEGWHATQPRSRFTVSCEQHEKKNKTRDQRGQRNIERSQRLFLVQRCRSNKHISTGMDPKLEFHLSYCSAVKTRVCSGFVYGIPPSHHFCSALHVYSNVCLRSHIDCLF